MEEVFSRNMKVILKNRILIVRKPTADPNAFPLLFFDFGLIFASSR